MSKELKALEILKHYTGSVAPVAFTPKVISEAIKELEEYEQNFKQKEFNYRTQCQSVLSAGRVEADDMPDRLAELEKVILDYYLDKGYQVGSGDWGFDITIISRYKGKNINVMFYDFINGRREVNHVGINWEQSLTTKEMWDKAIAHFSTRQNEVMDMNNDLPNSSN